MIKNKISKLKKYLFLISILFFVITGSHLVYNYLYSDSELVPIKGGTISEGLIGNFPSLNPIKPLSGNNKYIIDLLYRSLLTYDINEQKIIGDLASCDISSLKNIECYLKEDAIWSNGEKITNTDVISTYELIKETNSNKIVASLLSDTEIIENGDSIIFKNPNNDVNFLNIFFQPIISKNTIDSLTEENIYGNFPTTDEIYSGDFVIGNISSDLTLGFSKITLNKNPNSNPGNISNLILKIFSSTSGFLKNKEGVNIFNDKENIIGESVPRLESYQYILPQFVSLFINQENIKDKSLRNLILNSIKRENLIELLGNKNYLEINNPYLTETNIDTISSGINLEKIMSDEGYYKKSKLIDDLSIEKGTYSSEAQVEINEENLTIEEFQEDSKYIKKPEYVEKYNFITKDDILLIGNNPSNVEKIFINDYELRNFNSGDTEFYYRLKESYESIKEGRNNYKIYFQENGEKVLKEEVNFLYNKNSVKLEEEKEKQIKELAIEKAKKERENNKVNIEIDKDDLEKFSSLDENFYYNKNLEKYKLKLVYLNNDLDIEKSAIYIKNALVSLGIEVDLIPIGISQLSKIISDKSSYDLILTGLNLGYFDYNIFHYFHSSQAKNGYNFSNIKRTSLDLKLEELKSKSFEDSKTKEIKEKVLGILQEEKIMKTLYSPKINLLVDKNIKNISLPSKIPNKSLRNIILKSSYTRQEKIINFENKSLKNFFYYIYNKINE